MNRFDILKGTKPRRSRKKTEAKEIITIPKTDKNSQDLLSDAFLLSISMMDWFQRKNIEIGRYNFSPPEIFRKEFCTFRFGMPRRTGNTSLALRILQHYTNSIFIGINLDILNNLRQHHLPFNFERRRLYSIRQDEQVFRGLSADAVIVDMAYYIEPRQLEKIFFINSESFFLIG